MREKGRSSMMALMARLPEAERRELTQRIGRALERARHLDDIDQKSVEDLLQIDHGQHERQTTGVERFQLERAALASPRRPTFWGLFVACLLDEFGGWPEVMAHGSGHLIAAFVTATGQARMARAGVENPRRREESGCAAGSWRVSA
jgi:hypothetical protein